MSCYSLDVAVGGHRGKQTKMYWGAKEADEKILKLTKNIRARGSRRQKY